MCVLLNVAKPLACTGLGSLLGRNSFHGFFSGGNDYTSSHWFCGKVATLLEFGLNDSTWI